MEVQQERTGWRDEGISQRHRLWGVTCTATDIDFLLVEYNYNTPQKLSASQYQVLKNLGDRAQIPVLAVRYASDFSKFRVVPVNQSAEEFLPNRIVMTESEFVALLYRIRDINSVPSEVLQVIKSSGVESGKEQQILRF